MKKSLKHYTNTGTLLVRPYREPLDVVQDFAYASHLAGMRLSRRDMVRFVFLRFDCNTHTHTQR